MSKFLLLIPIIVGIAAGLFLLNYSSDGTDDKLLTKSKLIEGSSPVLGNPSASITILEWGDYQCTYCYRFHQTTLENIKRDYIQTGKIKMVFKDFPLNGPDSILAAEASYCANDQEKYWQYHNELYNNWGGERTGWITRYTLGVFAQTIGLNLDEFNKCLDNHKYLNKVNELHQFGIEIGIDATPSFLIFDNEKIIKIRGNQPLEVFINTIEEF